MYGSNLYCVTHTYSQENRDHLQRIQTYNPYNPKKEPYYGCTLIYNDYSNTDFVSFNLGIDKCPPNYQIIDRNMNILVVNFVISGKGTFNGIPFKKGECFYSLPGQTHSMIANPIDPWYTVWFAVNGTTSQQIIELLEKYSKNQKFEFSDSDELLQMATYFIYKHQHVHRANVFISGLLSMLTTFISTTATPVMDGTNVSAKHRAIIKEALAYVNYNIDTVTVESLASNAHLEVKYFSRIFEKISGYSPKKYIIRAKMNMAKYYLTETDHSIETITTLLGYNHRNSLTTAFKSIYGLPPQQYRENHFLKKE